MTITIETSTKTCAQPDSKSMPNPKPYPNPTTKQHAIVYVQLNIVTCPTYLEKLIQDNVIAPFVPNFNCNCHTATQVQECISTINSIAL